MSTDGRQVTEFGDVMLIDNEMWMKTDYNRVPDASEKLMNAIAFRKTTAGGLAEAGWQFIGLAHWLTAEGTPLAAGSPQ